MAEGNLHIEPVAQAADLGIIARLAAEVWPETYGRILTPQQIGYMMKMMYDGAVLKQEFASGVHFDILFRSGEPIGFVSYERFADGKAKLHKLYLLFSEHGKGCGSLLLRHVMKRCAELGCHSLKLNVNKYNASALAVYKHLGFREVEAVKNDIGNGFFMDDFVMETAL